jgi:glycosyltransferase involved in cell wall biosynthesis
MPSSNHASIPDYPILTLAVFGWVQEDGGSVSSAHFQLCRALLDAGHQLDFFADPSFISRPDYDAPGFNYVPIQVDFRYEVDPGHFWPGVRRGVATLNGMRRMRRFFKHGIIVARSRHQIRPYNAVLYLGTPPGPTISGVPTVVWPQSAPQNELLAIRGLARSIIRVSGLHAYLKLRLFYEVKDRLSWNWARRHNLILASHAARDEAIAFGVPPDRICVAPYPIDLTRFSPQAVPSGPVRRVLCVGRLDPRKRLDLLVDAVAVLASRRGDFQVDVIGRDGYVPGYRTLVEHASRELPMTYTGAIAQSEVIRLLHQADVVVQPSEHEEFGHAVAEALACGIPVVTGPTNHTAEYAPLGSSASFDGYNRGSLADAIDRALNISRDADARAACRTAAGAFAADRVAATVAAFVRGVTP